MTQAEAIEAFFLKDGKWSLEIIPEGHAHLMAGRWLDNSDSNYSFRAVDLLAAINDAGQ
jgi:hypothetical protein